MSIFSKFLPYYKYLRPVWWRFGMGISFGVLYSVSSGLGLPVMAETVFPVLFGNIDAAPEWLQSFVTRWFAEDIQGGFLVLCCILIPFTMLLRASGAVGNGYFMAYTGMHVVQAIQIDVFRKIQSMPLAFFQRYKTGELIAGIMGYPTQIKKIVVDTSNDLVKQPLTLISAVGFLVYKSFTSESFFTAIIGVLSVPFIVFPIRKIGKTLAKRSKQLVSLGEALSSSTIESVQSPVEIRAYNLEGRQNAHFTAQLREIFRISMKSVRTGLMISPSIEVVAAAGLALALFLGVRTGMSEGEFMALGVALYMAYTPLKKLGKIHGALRSLEAPLQRLEAILYAPDKISDPDDPRELPQPLGGSIQFEDVAFEYESGKPVLSDVNVAIAAGESVGLVGQSGAGKSTFVNLIPRFFELTAGSICIDGIDLCDVRAADVRDQVAYVPQTPLLFNASVIDNIRVGRPDASDEEVEQAARHAHAHSFIKNLPQGYSTVLTERGNSLSGGQRQRIAIARAFLKNAPILILDEATSALDNKVDAEIQIALNELSENRTTLIIAHRLNTLSEVSRRLYFENGRILGDGTHDELMLTSPGYRALANAAAQ